LKNKILVLSIILALVAVATVPMAVMAADTDTVDITVGSSTISCSVDPGTWAVGTITAGTPVSTFVSGTQGYFTLTNDGNVTEDFTIEGTDATGSTVTWTLVETLSTGDEYSLGFGQATDGASPPYDVECANYTEFDDSGDDTLTTGLAVAGTYKFDLQLNTNANTDVSEVMTATITVTAVAS